MKFRLPTCPTPRRKLTDGTRRFLEAFFTSLVLSAYKTADKIFKAMKSSNLLKFIGPMSRFSSHSRTSLRAEVSLSLTWPLAFAKPFMTVRNLRSQGKFENINFATDSYFIDQYFAKAISTYVPFYSLNLRRLARVELSFELEFFLKRNEKKA